MENIFLNSIYASIGAEQTFFKTFRLRKNKFDFNIYKHDDVIELHFSAKEKRFSTRKFVNSDDYELVMINTNDFDLNNVIEEGAVVLNQWLLRSI